MTTTQNDATKTAEAAAKEARLNAAAPELLAAISAFVKWADISGAKPTDNIAVPLNGKIMQRFRAAIAQAE